MLQVFPYAGWAAVRADLDDPARDVAMIFRSSPLGAISHSHANNNDFIVHAGGKVLAMPSGYYDGYGSDHHTHWVWHTRSHNCVTLSDASQDHAVSRLHGEDRERLRGRRAHLLSGQRRRQLQRPSARRCRRHVFFLKAQSCFVMIDEFAAIPGIDSALQWNIHSWNRFCGRRGGTDVPAGARWTVPSKGTSCTTTTPSSPWARAGTPRRCGPARMTRSGTRSITCVSRPPAW